MSKRQQRRLAVRGVPRHNADGINNPIPGSRAQRRKAEKAVQPLIKPLIAELTGKPLPHSEKADKNPKRKQGKGKKAKRKK